MFLLNYFINIDIEEEQSFRIKCRRITPNNRTRYVEISSDIDREENHGSRRDTELA